MSSEEKMSDKMDAHSDMDVKEQNSNHQTGKTKTVKRSEEAISGMMISKGVGVAIRYKKTCEANTKRPDLTERLPELSIPVLIVVGEEDTSEPPHISREMHGRIPGSRLEVIPGCGHRCNEERPETFNRIVEGFLEGVMPL